MSKKSKTYNLKVTKKDLKFLSDGEIPSTLVAQARDMDLKKRKGATKKQLKKALSKFIHKDDVGTVTDLHHFLKVVHDRIGTALATHDRNIERIAAAKAS